MKSQLMGICLAVFTALNVICYEKIVKNTTVWTTQYALGLLPILFLFCVMPWRPSEFLQRNVWLPTIIMFFASIIVTLFWYKITKNQSALTGSIYEIKYAAVLLVMYSIWGTGTITKNSVIGIICALLSVYFTSKG